EADRAARLDGGRRGDNERPAALRPALARRMVTASARLALLLLLALPGAASGATLGIGLTDGPGGAKALRKSAPFTYRYQYLAGGVNTGDGWPTWNPNGSFVTMYA